MLIPYRIAFRAYTDSCPVWCEHLSTIYATLLRDRGDAVALRYRNRTEITVLMSVPAEALWFPRRRKSYKVRCRMKIALVSSSRVPFQEGLNGVVAWRLNVSNFDGWRLNFRLFDGWRLTSMTPSFRAEIKPKSCPDGSPLEAIKSKLSTPRIPVLFMWESPRRIACVQTDKANSLRHNTEMVPWPTDQSQQQTETIAHPNYQ